MKHFPLALCLTMTLAIAPAHVSAAEPLVAPAPDWAGKLVSSEAVDVSNTDIPAGTRSYRIKYLSTDPRGQQIEVSGSVFIPSGVEPAGGRRVIAWDHGTTGIADDCAPSRRPTAGYDSTIGSYLRHGYAIAATDYPGLGTPGDHPYLVAQSEGRATIDSVRAARQIEPRLSSGWLAAGHSQGGQAAIATAEIASDYGNGLSFGGAVAYAPAPNLSKLVDWLNVLPQPLQPAYAMVLVGLKAQHPELRYADYLGARAQQLIPAIRTSCPDKYIPKFLAEKLPSSEFAPRTSAAAERLRNWLRQNEIGQQRADGPVFVAQGSSDPLVWQPITDTMVTDSKAHGSTVEYRVYQGADHGTVLKASESDVFRWLAAHTPRS